MFGSISVKLIKRFNHHRLPKFNKAIDDRLKRKSWYLIKKVPDVIGVLGPDDFKLTKGEDKLSLYQFYTNTAKHYFCSICGIHTHNRPRSNPKIYGVNIACIEGVEPFEIEDVPVNDGKNHPLDQKQ